MKKSIFKKGGELLDSYKESISFTLSMLAGNKLYIFKSESRGTKRILVPSYYAPTLVVLDFFKLPYNRGNDSPNGEKSGEYFTISREVSRKLLEIYYLF